MSATTFVAYWPITDQSVGWDELIKAAEQDLPLLLGQARCRKAGPGAFRIARSVDVPGSGRLTPTVLVFEAPAWPRKPRAYHRRTAA